MTGAAPTARAHGVPPQLPAEATGTSPGPRTMVGRRLLVVGGGQQTYGQADPPIGIGRAISVLAAREGAAVAVADIDPEAAASTVEHINTDGGLTRAFTLDGTREPDVKAVVGAAAEHLGGLDALVMNLGIAAGHTLAGTSPEDWDHVMATNVRSHFLGCKHARNWSGALKS